MVIAADSTVKIKQNDAFHFAAPTKRSTIFGGGDGVAELSRWIAGYRARSVNRSGQSHQFLFEP